jgi:hypothetical protein
MFFRPLIIGTILTGIGAITIAQFIVRPHVKSMADARNRALSDYQNEKNAHTQTKSRLEDTQVKDALSERNFEEAKSQLAVATAKATGQEKRANLADRDLAETKKILAGVQADLAAWNSLSIPVEQVKSLVSQVKKLRATTEALEEEKQLLAAILKKSNNLINRPDFGDDPLLPSGLKGKVLVVDPKYDFVVLDIGADKGVEQRGTLLVSRNNKLVAKVKVARVEPERSIANIVPGWKLDQVIEGDQVIVR